MEDQIGDLRTFLEGMQSWMDQQHSSLKAALEVNTSVLQDLSNQKPQEQSKVEDL